MPTPTAGTANSLFSSLGFGRQSLSFVCTVWTQFVSDGLHNKYHNIVRKSIGARSRLHSQAGE